MDPANCAAQIKDDFRTELSSLRTLAGLTNVDRMSSSESALLHFVSSTICEQKALVVVEEEGAEGVQSKGNAHPVRDLVPGYNDDPITVVRSRVIRLPLPPPQVIHDR